MKGRVEGRKAREEEEEAPNIPEASFVGTLRLILKLKRKIRGKELQNEIRQAEECVEEAENCIKSFQ